MRIRSCFSLIFALAMAASLAAQTRSVTNASLARYKDDRARAYQEYLENYERLGMPSPAEIERRKDESRTEMQELSQRLRSDNLERQRLAAELLMNARLTAAQSQPVQRVSAPYYDGSFYGGGFYGDPYWAYFYGSPIYGGGRHNRFGFRRPFFREGYVGGGQWWPTGPRTPSRPMIRTRRPVAQPTFSPNR